MKNIINSKQLFNSKNIADKCDLVYSQKVSVEEYRKIDKSLETVVISKTNNLDYRTVLYKLKKFTIKNNFVIYCHTDLVEDFFVLINNETQLKNLTLITGQSDRKIDKSLFESRPPSIVSWYSPNVSYKNLNLIPIPLGIADKFSKKNLNTDDISKKLDLSYGNKINKIYINFSINTNFSHRKNLYKAFRNKDFAVIDQANITNTKYHENLKKYNFTLCPWGNGVDTHRMWEALYSGSIPITMHHQTYSRFKENFPILFVNNYRDINLDLMNKTIQKINNPNPFSLDTASIFELITYDKKNEENTIYQIYESSEIIKNNLKNYNKRESKLRLKKKLSTYHRKIYQKIFKI
jgi:hypothetical protein